MHDDVNSLFFYSALGILHAVVLPGVPHPQTSCQAKQILRAAVGEITGVHCRVKLWQLPTSTMGEEEGVSAKTTARLLVL